MKPVLLQAIPTPIAQPMVTRAGALTLQVCVPEGWTDDQVKSFANERNLAGTTHGWSVCKAGNSVLVGDPERVPCEANPGYVHVMMDC
jgi:hypothetical protein